MRALFVHGMGRSPFSGWPMLRQLRKGGLDTSTFGYCATFENFSDIKNRLVNKLTTLASQGEYVVIGHSLGGVLLRAAIDSLPNNVRKPKHLFLLASPIKPAKLAILLQANPIYRMVTGDCGQLLGSSSRMSAIPAASVPNTAIVGVRGLPFETVFSKEEPNDGIVSVSEVTADWLNEQVQIDVPHSFICSSRRVAKMILDRLNCAQARSNDSSQGVI